MLLQALALEKLLMVTSTVQPSQTPPERPTLASLPPVNENPSPPVMPTANGPIRVCHPASCQGLHMSCAKMVFCNRLGCSAFKQPAMHRRALWSMLREW